MNAKKNIVLSTRLIEFFKERVMGPIYTTCHYWIGPLDAKGYGKVGFKENGVVKQYKAHRTSYEIHKGKVPSDMYVCHSCDNPRCVNPDHLWLGNANDNIQDMIKKGRIKKWDSRRKNSKLTDDQVRAILKDTRIHRLIAQDYGICRETIGPIKRGQAWRHVIP